VALLFGGGALAGLAAGEGLVAGLCFFLLVLTFVASILVRWPGIRSSHYVGGYLIVMVSRGCVIIVPPSAAPAERLRAFAQELERRRTVG
jgi:uncharacterized RDD family membrane protein YckC